eukprot:3227783-Rhodomonas_salina.3
MQTYKLFMCTCVRMRAHGPSSSRASAHMSNISLASATGTRADSAAKHIIVARICTDFYTQFLRNAGDLLQDKQTFLAARDEICLGVGRPFNAQMGFSHAENKAYVPVITNVAVLKNEKSKVSDFYVDIYDARTMRETKEIAKHAAPMPGGGYYPSELFFAGIALTQAFAHPHSGDTALSSMIGGIKTIQNGRFPCCPGDEIM